MWSAKQEMNRIVDFTRQNIKPDTRLFIPVSGGIDSDLVARLAFLALGPDRVRLLTITHPTMDPVHLQNIRDLGEDLRTHVCEIDASRVNESLRVALDQADRIEPWQQGDALDAVRISLATRIASLVAYRMRGYDFLGTANRTEYEFGFYAPSLEGGWVLAPIFHLYKTQVMALAAEVGSRDRVVKQPPSAGFRDGETDFDDMAYWLLFDGPISVAATPKLSQAQEATFAEIHGALSIRAVDLVLIGIDKQKPDDEIARAANVPKSLVARFRKVIDVTSGRRYAGNGHRLEPTDFYPEDVLG